MPAYRENVRSPGAGSSQQWAKPTRLPSNGLPTLVTFSDPNNSASLRVIRPEQLEQTFGPNVHWRGVVIEMTTDPVTRGLEARLPFLVLQKNVLRDPIGDPNKFIPKYHAFIRS
jgi:hypothetical protein